MKSGSICKQTVFKTGNVKSGNVKKKTGKRKEGRSQKTIAWAFSAKKSKTEVSSVGICIGHLLSVWL